MTRCCSWCGRNMGQKTPFSDRSVTHGICLACSAEVIETAKRDENLGSSVVNYSFDCEPSSRARLNHFPAT